MAEKGANVWIWPFYMYMPPCWFDVLLMWIIVTASGFQMLCVLMLWLPPPLCIQEDNLQQVISHGLQCVVKGNLEQAETIFTHALYLPDFQRLPLKAFVYICLAVLANKRNKQK